MEICCPGPSSTDILWIPCGSSGPGELVPGHAGISTSSKGEHCQIVKVTWTTAKWTLDASPAQGDTVGFQGAMYFIDSVVKAGCTVVIVLCRPVLDCPNCSASLYRLVRIQEDCLSRLVPQIYATEVPALICTYDKVRRVIDNAEVLVESVQICLDTTEDFQVGDLVVCGEDVWRIDRIESRCASSCLARIIGIREPWSIIDATNPPEPFDAIAEPDLTISGIDIIGVGLTGNPPTDHIASSVALSISGIQIAGTGTMQGLFTGFSTYNFPTIAMVATGGYLGPVSGVGNLSLSGIQLGADGLFIEQAVGESAFDVSGLQVSADGLFIEQNVGEADFDISGLQVSSSGLFIAQAVGEGDFDISGLQVTAAGVNNSPVDGIADFDISGIQIAATGDVDNAPTDHIGTSDLFVSGIQVDADADYQPPFEGTADLIISGAQITSTGDYQPPFEGTSDLFVSGAQITATGDFITPRIGTSDFTVSGLQVAADGNFNVSDEYIGTASDCPLLTTISGDTIITIDGDTILAGDECGITISGLTLSATGTMQGLFTGTSSLTISGARVQAAGEHDDPSVYDATPTIAISGLQILASAAFGYPELYEGDAGFCEPWTIETGDPITIETGEAIDFGYGCGWLLSGLTISGTGSYADNTKTGVAAMTTDCIQTSGTVNVAPFIAPNNALAAMALDCTTIQGAVTVAGPQPANNATPTLTTECIAIDGDVVVTSPIAGTSSMDVPCTTTSGNVSVADPGETDLYIAMTGGFYVPEGFETAQVVYPLEDIALWRFAFVFPEVDDAEAMFLTLPVAVPQGQLVDDARLVIVAEWLAFGSSPAFVGNLTAWDVDHAPPVDQGWNPLFVAMSLPRTTASVVVSLTETSPDTVNAEVDVTSIVNEIISRPGWVSGNRILFILETDLGDSAADRQVIFEMDPAGAGGETHLEITPGS